MIAAAIAGIAIVMMTRAHAASLTYCVYDDAACTNQVGCIDVSNTSCTNGDGAVASTNAEIDCVGETVQNLTINVFVGKDCLGTPTQFPVMNVKENECYAAGADSLKFTKLSCSDGDCFPASAMVQLEDGSRKTMDQVMIGDMLKVSANDQYSPVVFWGHKDEHAVSNNFVRVTFEDERVIMLTANHLVYVKNVLMPANRIRAGMSMKDGAAGHDVVVKSVEFTMHAKGLYNPHTAHGDVVVDGIVVSSYGSVAPHLAHALLAVERLMRWFGLSALGDILEKSTPWLLQRVMSILA